MRFQPQLAGELADEAVQAFNSLLMRFTAPSASMAVVTGATFNSLLMRFVAHYIRKRASSRIFQFSPHEIPFEREKPVGDEVLQLSILSS